MENNNYRFMILLFIILSLCARAQLPLPGGSSGGGGNAGRNIRDCAPASASGTAYTCTTAPAFTPADNDTVLLIVDTDNTGPATLAVNGATAATIKKKGGTSDLSAGDLKASQRVLLVYDGTYWQAQAVATASGSDYRQEIQASAAAPPSTPNTQYTAIDGGAKNAELHTDAGYYKRIYVAHF